MADIAPRYTVKTGFAVKSCLPMKVCKSEVYKNIGFIIHQLHKKPNYNHIK